MKKWLPAIIIFGVIGIFIANLSIDNHFARIEQQHERAEWSELTEVEKLHKTNEMIRAGELKPERTT